MQYPIDENDGRANPPQNDVANEPMHSYENSFDNERATPASSDAEIKRSVGGPASRSSTPAHQRALPLTSPLSSPIQASSTITVALESYICSGEGWGALGGAWSRMGYCATTQAALLNNLAESVVAHVGAFVAQQVEYERAEAAKVEMLFEEAFLLSQRLDEPVTSEPLRDLFNSLHQAAAALQPATTSISAQDGEGRRHKRKIVRLVGGTAPFNGVTSKHSHQHFSNQHPHGSDVAECGTVDVPMPVFACPAYPSTSFPTNMLSPKLAHASRPTGEASSRSHAFITLSHAKQLEILTIERRRFIRLAEERVEFLRLIYCGKRLLDVPVRQQEELRSCYARALFAPGSNASIQQHASEDLRGDSVSSSAHFFTPNCSPRVTTNQDATATTHLPGTRSPTSNLPQDSIPEVVTAAVRAVSRVRSLSVTARAYPADHPLCTPHDAEGEISSKHKSINDAHCQNILKRGAHQDLSMERVALEAQAVTHLMLRYVRSMVDAVQAESAAIDELSKEVGGVSEGCSAKIKSLIEQTVATFGGSLSFDSCGGGAEGGDSEGLLQMFDQQFNKSVLFHQFPLCVAQLFTIKLPIGALLEVSSERERLQAVAYDLAFVRFAELQHEVWASYKAYFTATGDQSYASPPDFSDALSGRMQSNALVAVSYNTANRGAASNEEAGERCSDQFGSCKSSAEEEADRAHHPKGGSSSFLTTAPSRAKTLAESARSEYEDHRTAVRRLNEASAKYEDILTNIASRMSILKEIEPLLRRRDYILGAQSNMQSSSKERLLSRSVNMAKQLREEEALRRMIHKEVPSIIAQVVALCDAWEALTHTRMVVNSKDVLRVVSGMPATPAADSAVPKGESAAAGLPQFIYGADAASTTPTPPSRLGSPVPPGSARAAGATSRSPVPAAPRRQQSSQVPSPSPQPGKSRAATPVTLSRTMSRGIGVRGAVVGSISPQPRSVTPSRVAATPSTHATLVHGNGTVTTNGAATATTNRVRIASISPPAPRAAGANGAAPTSRGASDSARHVSRSLAQPPSRAQSRSKAVSPPVGRSLPTAVPVKGTAAHPVQHPTRSSSPQPKATSFSRPPPLSATSVSARKGTSASALSGSKRSRSLTPQSIRDGLAPSVPNPNASVQPRSFAPSRSRQALLPRSDANISCGVPNSGSESGSPSTAQVKTPSIAVPDTPISSPSYVPQVFTPPPTAENGTE